MAATKKTARKTAKKPARQAAQEAAQENGQDAEAETQAAENESQPSESQAASDPAPENQSGPGPDDDDDGALDLGDAEAIMERCRFSGEGLIGELADFLLSDLRASRDLEIKSYAALSADDQQALIERAQQMARTVVQRVVEAVASKGLARMSGVMADSGGFKDGQYKLTIAVPMNARNSLLLSQCGRTQVQIALTSVQAFEGPMTAMAEPDQPELAMDRIDPETGEILDDDPAPVFDRTPAGRDAAPPTR